MLGAAIGDALGSIADERLPGGGTRRPPIRGFVSWTLRAKGLVDRIAAGEYSAATQLTLAVARCIDASGRFDASRFSEVELVAWLDYERGAREGLRAAASNAANARPPWDDNDRYFKDSASEPVVRVLPHAIAAPDWNSCLRDVWRN